MQCNVKFSVTATVGNEKIVHNGDPNEGTNLFNRRDCPDSFWRQIADALDLPGDRNLLCVRLLGSGLKTEFGSEKNSFIGVGKIGICCGERISTNHTDYTVHPSVIIPIETFTRYF
jgi:hypothetical protein